MKPVVAPVGLLIAFFAGIVMTLALERYKDVNDEAYRAAIARADAEVRAATPVSISAVAFCGTNMGAFVSYGDGHVKFFEFSDPEFRDMVQTIPQANQNTLSAGGSLCGSPHAAPSDPPVYSPWPGERPESST